MNSEHVPPASCSTLARPIARDDTLVSHGQRSNTPLRVIIADDHPVVLVGAEVALSAAPGTSLSIVAQANNADELIDHLQRTSCDLLISDYSMPCGRFPDGLALMGYLRRHYSHLPLIVMTMLRKPASANSGWTQSASGRVRL